MQHESQKRKQLTRPVQGFKKRIFVPHDDEGRITGMRDADMASNINWKDATVPSLADFETIAAAAWERIAPEFREVCEDLVIRIEDFAPDEVLDELEIDSPFDLMGLYQGLSLDRKSVSDIPREPDMVFLYRRAILDYWCESDETLDEIITHVLVHEIGHHFGFSDADMEEIESHSAA